jgi:hypothetical protein
MASSLRGLGEGGRERGTQQENSYTKQAITNRLPARATLGRVKEARILEFVDNVVGQTFLQKVLKDSDADNKNKQTRFLRSQGGYKMLFMTCICT